MPTRNVTVTIGGDVRRAGALVEGVSIDLTRNSDGDLEGSGSVPIDRTEVHVAVTLFGEKGAAFTVDIAIDGVGKATRKGKTIATFRRRERRTPCAVSSFLMWPIIASAPPTSRSPRRGAAGRSWRAATSHPASTPRSKGYDALYIALNGNVVERNTVTVTGTGASTLMTTDDGAGRSLGIDAGWNHSFRNTR